MQNTNLYTTTVPPMIKGLKALKEILAKAAAHADTKKLPWATYEHALLQDHMIFDQFPLVKQIQVTCDTAKGAAARLAEIEIPKHEDTETTIPQLIERIDKTLAFVESVKEEQIVGKEDIKVTISYFPGKYMTGFGYATEYAVPNFYFHLGTAYNLLRKNGVELGKNDFLGSLPLKDM
jgi:uncharacterized protein